MKNNNIAWIIIIASLIILKPSIRDSRINGYELRGKLYVESCTQCKTYQGLECYEDLNKGQESIEKNCVECDYSYREEK